MTTRYFIAILLFFGIAMAEPTAPTGLDPAPKTVKEKSEKVKIHKLKGILESIDLQSNQLVIQKGDKKETLSIDATAKIKIDGKMSQAKDLKPGSRTRVYYEVKDDMKIVKQIKAKAPKAVKAKKKDA